MKPNASVTKGISIIREAVSVRKSITKLYKQYRDIGDIACFAAEVNQNDLKRAVDALYYLGGGWPSETSKGRMEALLENFVGMYRILDFIGSGHLVVEHLAKFGVTVQLAPEFQIADRELDVNEKTYLHKHYSSEYFNPDDLKTVKELLKAVIMECQDLQRDICQYADQIKTHLNLKMKNMTVCMLSLA